MMAKKAISYDEDDLYFGSRRVCLVPVEGEVIAYDHKSYGIDWSTKALVTTLSRGKLQSSEPDGANDIVVPCIPAREISRLAAASTVPSTTTTTGDDTCASAEKNPIATWPQLLRRPLLKVSVESIGDFASEKAPSILLPRAVASGVRSCLVKAEEDGRWYRLKGCGNNDQGFIVREFQGADGKMRRELRGCAFHASALRENYMTSRLASRLGSAGIPACNEARGMFVYGPKLCTLGTKNPELNPVCIVEATSGDRRLGTHLLAGIELILPLLVSTEHVEPRAIAALFPAARPHPCNRGTPSSSSTTSCGGDGSSGDVSTSAASTGANGVVVAFDEEYLKAIPATAELMYDNMVSTLSAIPGMSMYAETHWNVSSLACLVSGKCAELGAAVLNESAPDPDAPPPAQWSNAGAAPMPDGWRPLWIKACQQLQAARTKLDFDQNASVAVSPAEEEEEEEEKRGKNENGSGGTCAGGGSLPPLYETKAASGAATATATAGRPGILAYLYAQIGAECGRFLRALHNERISWSTYQDEMCRRDLDEWHCNAHSNNMVVLQETEARRHGCLLGYLDLDMAFDQATFVDPAKAASVKAAVEEEEEVEGEEDESAAESSISDLEWDRLLLREAVNFMEVLAGGDASSGVPAVAQAAVAAQGPRMHAVRAALNDTLILSFRNAYESDTAAVRSEDVYPTTSFDKSLHEAAIAVCKLALITMADFVA